MFSDRIDAGRRLADALSTYADQDVLVLGVPRGGVLVAAEVARRLRAALDTVVVRKIGHPANPEYGIAAIDAHGRMVTGAHAVDEAWLRDEGARQQAEAARREREYRSGVPAADVSGRTVLLIDDGIATGSTLRVAVEGLKDRGVGRVVVAAPVASAEAVRMLAGVADEVVVLEQPVGFRAVGMHYEDFAQTSDAEVIAALADANTG